jgi:acyl-[acyl-carrier-protein]-phospholipid O-acyltransferase/long-chain-fatty-acid--[acyl-carrier-protein] ligase
MLKLLRLLFRLLFRFAAYNEAVLHTPGPVLLLPNHLSWLDWIFLGVCLERDWRFVASSTTAQRSFVHRWIMVNRRTFPVDPLSPYGAKHMAEYLRTGGRLVLFPEGRLSATGSLMKLFDGTGFLLHRADPKIIVAYLRGNHRLPYSPNSDRKRLFPRITVHFSEVLTAPRFDHLPMGEARSRLTAWLRDRLLELQLQVETAFGPRTVPEAIRETARRCPTAPVLRDVTHPWTYRRLLRVSGVLASIWREVLPVDTSRVGVLLPNVNTTPAVLLSLWSLGRVPAVLNYTTGPAIMLACVQLAGVTHIITTRAFVERARLRHEPLTAAGVQRVYLEDVRARLGLGRKLAAAAGLLRLPRPASRDPGATAVILFTSGSEGVPKGVELTHGNLLVNVRQMLAVCDLQDGDRMFNALPLFHSFGLTAGLLLPLVRGFPVLLYPSPLHYRIIPMLVYLENSTILLSTNTFLNLYARRAHRYDFHALRYLFAGAEKVQDSTAAAWAQLFGVRVLEGYGATECSPVIAVNTPLAPKAGAAGRLLPGMEWRIEPVEGVAAGGRLLVRGPNVMKGYLNPEANARFQALGGWYDTGDIARVDDERFVHIQGRLKRFAKISGEMVSLGAIEDALAGAWPHYGPRCQVAVLAQPDEVKGEKLVAVTTEPRLKLEDLRAAVRARGLPPLWAPRELRWLRDLPRLGTGKVNYRELEQLVGTGAQSDLGRASTPRV